MELLSTFDIGDVVYGREWTTGPSGVRIRELTIARVIMESGEDHFVEQYMCEETGVDSGMIWDIESLYATREEAETGRREMYFD